MDHRGHRRPPPGCTSPAGLGSAGGRQTREALLSGAGALAACRRPGEVPEKAPGEPNRAFGMLQPLNAFHMVAVRAALGHQRLPR